MNEQFMTKEHGYYNDEKMNNSKITIDQGKY